MLFTKKTRFSIGEKQIKEELKSPEGVTALKINIRYPEIKCQTRDPLSVNAAPFYKRVAEGFAEYAKNELASIAFVASKTEGFAPYSAVMTYEKCFEDDRYISFYIDISVSDGIEAPITERKTQVWERKFGTKCRFLDFFEPKAVKDIFEGIDKRAVDRELFVMRDGGLEFFVRKDNGYEPLFASFEKISGKICK